jgi:hypothetical protein
MEQTQHVFNVTLVVKGMTRKQAENEAARRLNAWFLEDANMRPFPEGSLLHWGIRNEETIVRENSDER